MTIIVPVDQDHSLHSMVSGHFGRAAYFAVFEKEGSETPGTLKIIPNKSQHTGGRGLPAQNVLALNPDIVISTGMGRHAIIFFQQARVGVLQCPSGTMEQVITLFNEKNFLN
ncbi:MAG: NifB/NifX family molybdenum-iron cluster-binding protein [Candidatus Hodarchaeota archaeon]